MESVGTEPMGAEGMVGEEVIRDNPLTVGEQLKDARENHAVSDLKLIAQELCIRPHLLSALEENDFSSFASSCYATGFLKSYASYLDLDATKIVAQYKTAYAGAEEKVVLDFPEISVRDRFPLKVMAPVVSLSLLVLVGLGVSFSKININSDALLPQMEQVAFDLMSKAGSEQTETVVAQADIEDDFDDLEPVTAKYASAASFALVQKAQAKPAPVAANNMHSTAMASERIRLVANRDIWVRIVGPEKNIIMDGVLLSGEEFFAPDRQELVLMTSDAAALAIHVGDQHLTSLGDDGEIVEGLLLDQNQLMKKTAFYQP